MTWAIVVEMVSANTNSRSHEQLWCKLSSDDLMSLRKIHGEQRRREDLRGSKGSPKNQLMEPEEKNVEALHKVHILSMLSNLCSVCINVAI